MRRKSRLLAIIFTSLVECMAASYAIANPNPSSDDILLSLGEGSYPTTILDYSSQGVFIRSLSVPPNRSEAAAYGTEFPRGIAVMDNGQISCFNGTFAPELDIYQPYTNTFSYATSLGWHITNTGYEGDVAIFQGYSFVTSEYLVSGDFDSALIRFNPDGTSQRFGVGTDYLNVSCGLDGNLYALYLNTAKGTFVWDIDVFNPITLQKIRTINLNTSTTRNAQTIDLANLAIGKTGEIYVAELSGIIYHFDKNGGLIKSINHGHGVYTGDIKIDPKNDRILISVGGYDPLILQTNAQLSSIKTLIDFGQAAYGQPFIAFSNSNLAEALQNAVHVLWAHGDDGQIMISRLDDSGAATYRSYSASKGWIAKAIADTPDEYTHVLWQHEITGQICVWNIAPNGSVAAHVYGPFSGQIAKAMSAGPDGKLHILWSGNNSVQSLWTLDNTQATYTHNEYGPCAGWTAAAITTSDDNVTHILWRQNATSQMSLWNINPSGVTSHNFGPYSGEVPLSISAGPDGQLHPLWEYRNSANSGAELWSLDSKTEKYKSISKNQSGGWQTKNVATDRANVGHILWSNNNGSASIWSTLPDGTFGIHAYGPYIGWNAVDITTRL